MSESFLHELFQKCNIVHLQGGSCGICMQDYDTLSRETGTIEVAVCLPCNHIVGSACIATWLKDNNTCPFCRREFFPAQSRPHLEQGIIHDEEINDQGDQRSIREIVDDFCTHLELDMEISMISRFLVQELIASRLLDEGHTEWCVIAVSIYMASHITGRPRSPGEISEVADLEADHIRETYDIIYPERNNLTDARLLALLEDMFDQTGPLSWPARGHEVTDEEIENWQALAMLKERCEEGCHELGLVAAVGDFATRVATKLFTGGLMARLSFREMTAASIFMASHMTHHPVSLGRVAGAICMSGTRVRDAYGVAYDHQQMLGTQPWIESPPESIVSLLRRLPSP